MIKRSLVLDLETTMKCPVGNNKANPFWPENSIVLAGWKPILGWEGSADSARTMSLDKDKSFVSFPAHLIGHNIAFDLHHLLQNKNIDVSTLAKAEIWDTQLAEYLLSGQTHRFASLDECSERRGGTKKDERVGVMFAAGKGADEVPRNMLADYLKEDLNNTAVVFNSQYAEAMDRGMLPLLLSQMDARLATIDMIWNGLAVDKTFLQERAQKLYIEVCQLENSLRDVVKTKLGEDLDPTSPQQLATILFGGSVREKVKKLVGTYKNGNPKYVTDDVARPAASFNLLPPLGAVRGKNGKYSTDDGTLEWLASCTKGDVYAFVKGVQDYRAKSKELSTYFEGILSLIMPDGKVHHNLNHCLTATGRLSSSDPNLQNVTDGSKSDIKKAFVSRWGDDGIIVEADYGQLEMVMLAVLSGDEQLNKDIRDGVDMHRALFKDMHGREMRTEERKPFKRCSFALVYGAGAGGVAEQGGISKPEAKRFIDTFYTRYPGVKKWHEEMFAAVEAGRYYEGKKDKDTGLPVGEGCLVSPMSKRCYVFREYVLDEAIARWKKKTVGFSPTEIKNYPVQGGATGDIVPLVLGKLFRVLRNSPVLWDKCLLINTVHDSVMFDVHKSVYIEAITTIKRVMESAPTYIKETFGFDFPLKLKVGLSCGPNWMEQTEITFTEDERKAA